MKEDLSLIIDQGTHATRAMERPRHWPRPGRGRWFRPAKNQALIDRYLIFCEEMG